MEEQLPPRRAPKPRRRRQRRIFGLWARLSAMGVFVVILIAAAVALVGKIMHPYHEARLQAAEMQQTQARIAVTRADNERLVRRVAYLKTPQGIASEARLYGYLHPGEIPLVFSQSDPVSASAPLAPNALRPPSLPERARLFWRRTTGQE